MVLECCHATAPMHMHDAWSQRVRHYGSPLGWTSAVHAAPRAEHRPVALAVGYLDPQPAELVRAMRKQARPQPLRAMLDRAPAPRHAIPAESSAPSRIPCGLRTCLILVIRPPA